MRTIALLLALVAVVAFAKSEEKKTEKKRGPAAEFLYTVRQRLSALHLQLSVDFRALSACKSAACRAAARSRIRDVKRAELLTRRARGHIRLGRIFRDAASCTNSHCRARLRREVRDEQRKMRALIRHGANERAKEAKLAAARLAHRAEVAAHHAHHAAKIAHHLNHHEKRQRASRFLQLARHFHGMGLLYAQAADCHSHDCERRYLRKIREYRREQKNALERVHQEGVLEALKRARDGADELGDEPAPTFRTSKLLGEAKDLFEDFSDILDGSDLSVDATYELDDHARKIRREAHALYPALKRDVLKLRETPSSEFLQKKVAREEEKAKEILKEIKKEDKKAEKKAEEKKEEKKEEPKKDEAKKVEKAVEVAKTLEKAAEKEVQKLEKAKEELPAGENAIKKELEVKIETDKKLKQEFAKAKECETPDCIRSRVEEVKEIKEASKEKLAEIKKE